MRWRNLGWRGTIHSKANKEHLQQIVPYFGSANLSTERVGDWKNYRRFCTPGLNYAPAL